MSSSNTREVWLRGPVAGVPALLQPVAHALLQARNEVLDLVAGLPDSHLWERPAGVASPGFHLQHLHGVLDRLFTYARGEPLNSVQLAALAAEGTPAAEATGASLARDFAARVERAVEELRTVSAQTLTVAREVGRARLPSTVLGLYVHAAEHTQRHVGQLLVTVRVLQGGAGGSGAA